MELVRLAQDTSPQIVMALGPLVLPLIAAGTAVASGLINHFSSKSIAKQQNAANMRYLEKQNEYNTPANQMQRYQDAGLNPYNVLGQGTPGNQTSTQQAVGRAPLDFRQVMEALPLFNQTRMVSSQVQAQDANTVKAIAQTNLARVQTKVLEGNPMLDKEYVDALVSSMKSAAEIKASESSLAKQKEEWSLGVKSWKVDGVDMHGPAGALKMEYELQTLLKRFDLSTQDQKIKAEILKSKEFQNAILEVQKKFMTDAEITPQHILQFIQLLLMKLL